jgi:protein O-mannosyl-transferase
MRDPGAPTVWRLKRWQVGILLFGLALGCYWPGLNGGMLWDDQAHVTRPDLRSLAGLGRIWTDLHATQQYYPLLHSAFWFEHRLWGDATLGYHLINVALHAAAAGLLILLLRQIKVPGAGLAGVIFVVHPVCVESVAWISEQKNTLSLVLYLGSALLYLHSERLRDAGPASGRAAWAAYGEAFALFVFALLTKSVTATLPAALLVVIWWQRRRLSWRRDAVRLIPWFMVAVASGLFTAWVERRFNGAIGPEFDLTFGQRCLLAAHIIWFYVGKLLWPARLIFIYPHWDVRSAASGWVGYLAAVGIVTAVLWAMRRRWRGPLAAWLFFVGSLFPALGFFPVFPFSYSYVADHFQYVASIGLIAAAAAGATLALARCPPSVRILARAGIAGLIAVLVLLSRAQCRNYRDIVTLYTATLAQNPDCFMAHNNLGIEREHAGQLAAAESEYRAAIAIKPDLPDAHYNLGHLWLAEPGRSGDAAVQFQEALRLRPYYPEAHDNLGNALVQSPDRLDDAIAQYQEALRQRPNYPEALFNLGTVLNFDGRTAEAAAEFEALLRIDPASAQAHYRLGNIWLKEPGRLDDAIAQFEAAIRLQPRSAEYRLRLAVALLKGPGRTREAVAQLEEALRLQPDLTAARRLLLLVQEAHL